jgi:RNA polymerase sigma-70 factor (ECF subfamily)
MEKNIEYLNNEAEDNIEEKIEKEDLVLKLDEAVKKLPDKYENVIGLYAKGFNEKQIAKFLSISRGTVKSRIHRGKEKLKEILDKEKIYV